MKRKIKIVTDSCSSLTRQECEEMDIVCLETNFMVDGNLHNAFDDESVSLKDFYEELDKSKSCSTGCVNEQAFTECFEGLIEKDCSVIYIGLSSFLSSTYSHSEAVANNLNEKYNEKVVSVVDSRCGSYGILLLIEKAQEMIKQNMSLQEIEDALNETVKNMAVSFVPRDLSFMYKCGRISAVEAGIGKLLHIVPIVSVSEIGKLKVSEKCLGFKNAMKTLKNKYATAIKNKGLTKCYITSCNLDQDTEALKQFILENTDIKEVKTGLIDKTLACCCGPKTIAIFCG